MTLYNFTDTDLNREGETYGFEFVPRGTRPSRNFSRFITLSSPSLTTLTQATAEEIEYKLVYIDPYQHDDASDAIHALRGTFRPVASHYESTDDGATLSVEITPATRALKIVHFADHPLSPHFKGHYKLREVFTPFGLNEKQDKQSCATLLGDYRPYLHPWVTCILQNKPIPIFK